jgi:hypothetical protein
VTVILEDVGDDMKTFDLIVSLLIWGALGVVCLCFPYKVQDFAIRTGKKGPLSRNTFIESFVKSKKYLNVVRAVGVIAIITFCFLAWAFFRNL